MTATAVAPAGAVATPDLSRFSNARVSFVRAVRSELIKLTSLRSTWWSLAVATVLSVGMSLLLASFPYDGMNPTFVIVAPMQFTMLVAAILGVIVVTGEYSTGMIRSTLTAVPRRGAVVASKALATAILMALASAAIFTLAVVASMPMLDTQIDWSSPEDSIVPLAFGVLSMVSVTVLGVGLGFMIRSGAGAIAAIVGLLFVLPIVLSIFTGFGDAWQWLVDASNYLPSYAAQILTTTPGDDLVPALLTILGWPIAGLIGAWVTLRARDA